MNSSQPTDPRIDIRSEARGPHWVAWRSGGDTSTNKPAPNDVGHPRAEGPAPSDVGRPRAEGLVLLVGQTREEAEARAQRWAARQGGKPT